MTSDTTPAHLHRRLRRWKALAFFLLGGVAILAGLCGFLLWSMDAESTRLVDRVVPAFNQLRQMSTTALSVQRSLLSGWVTTEADARERAMAHARTRIAAGKQQIGRLGSLELFQDSPALCERLTRAGQRYFAGATRLVGLLENRQWEQAVVLRHEVVKPALDDYLDAIEKAASFAESASIGGREVAGTEPVDRGTLVVGVNRWPVLGFATLAVTVVIMMLGLLLLTRGGDLDTGS